MALETKDNLINKQSRFLNFNNDLIQVHIHKYIQMFNIYNFRTYNSTDGLVESELEVNET